MGLKRFSGQFSYRKNGQTKNVTIVSPVVEENSTLTIYSSAAYHAYTERHAFAQWSPNPFFSRYAIPYYWDSDNDFDLAGKMIEGTQYGSFTALVEAFTSIALAELESPAAVGVILDSRDYPQFSSQEQGCFGPRNSTSFAMPYIQIKVEASAVNVQLQRSCLVEFSFWLGEAGTFNTSTGLWQKTGGLGLNIQSTSNNIYNSSEIDQAKIAFINDAIKIRMMPGVGAVITAGGTQFQFNNPGSYVWLWFLINDADVFIDSVGFIGTLCFYKFAVRNTTCAWNNSGDVDPTDPWQQPEPYPPTPPNPPTPDPPQPVDPVDPVPTPDDPPLGEVGTGFVTVYNPDRTDLNQLARKFWDQSVWDLLKQHFTNPFDAILGLTIIPVTPDRVANQPLVIGNYNTHIETNKVTSEYKTANLGSVYIPKFFNSYLDYDPYTKYQLYLPFIGEVALNADEITSKTINITYKVNVISGDCVALLSINNSVFAEYNGNCARQITVTKGNLEEILSNAVQFASTAVTMGMSMGATGAIGDAIESTAVNSAGELTKSGQIRLAGVEARMSSMGANTISAGINAVMGSKMNYSKAGNPGQGAGQISVRTPFITVTRPNLTLPEGSDQAGNSALKRYTGYPVNKIGPLSSFHGLTVVEACQLSSQHATDGEIAEALEIMRGGVIL